MARFDDADYSAPKIPGDTCPIINEVQEGVARVIKQLETAASNTEDEDASNAMLDAVNELYELTRDNRPYSLHKTALEQVRQANEELREVGKYWREHAKQTCSVLDDVQRTVEAV